MCGGPAGGNTDALHHTAENRQRGDSRPRGKAQWRGFGPSRAEPDGFLIHHPNHFVILLLPPDPQLPIANITDTHRRQGS
jgi:hypothetical protein